MNELDIIAQLKGEPMALIVLGGVVLIKLIEYAIKYAPRFFCWLFGKKKKATYEERQGDINEKIETIVKQIESRLNRIEKEALAVNSVISRLDGIEDKVNIALIQSNIGVAWSDKGAPFEETVWALLMNISLGENGNHKIRLLDVIMGQGKEFGLQLFRSIKNRFIKEREKELGHLLSDYFYETMNWLEKEVH